MLFQLSNMWHLTHETFDMAILAAPIVVTALMALTLLLFVFRCHRAGVVSAILLLMLNGWTEQVPVRMRREVPKVKEPGTLRIFEYNICGKVEYAPLHGREFEEYVLGQDADFLFLPENTVGVAPHFDDTLRQVYPYSIHCFKAFEERKLDYADFTLYSKYPLSSYRNYQVDNQELIREHPYLDSLSVIRLGSHFMAYEATADINGRAVTLLHVHMRSNTYDTAIATDEGRRQKVHNIYERLQLGYAFRDAEARAVRDSLRNCHNPLIICGDFNDVSGSHSLRMIQDCRRDNVNADHRDRLRDAWWEGGQGFGFTFADMHLRLRLDHILYSREFELKAVSVPKVPYSDHRPLVADFVLKD